MTHTCAKPSLKSFRFKNLTAKALMALTTGMAVCAPSIQAADNQWWFDIEVIVFERNIESANILEQFEQSSLAPPSSDLSADHSGDLIDLLTAYVKPDLSFMRAGLPYCRESKRLALAEKYQQDFALPITESSESHDQNKSDSDASTEIQVPELVEPAQLSTDRFEYEVASDDIFNDDINNTLDTNSAESALTQQPETTELQEQAAVLPTTPPIDVRFIEWQMPSLFPCVYSEQVDPILVLLDESTDTENSSQMRPDVTFVPIEIDGVQWQQKRGPFLLPKDTFRMDELFSKIQKQRNITPILHLNWRQQVLFGRENAETFRIFAGKNFAGQFDQTGQAIVPDTDQLITSLTASDGQDYMPLQELALEYSAQLQDNQLNPDQTALMAAQSSEQLFTNIDAALNDDSPISFALPIEQPVQGTETSNKLTKLQDIWQLDGGVKVYLQNVGRIPYLHIDSQLDYRHSIYRSQLAPTSNEATNEGPINVDQTPSANYLQSVRFNQLRRVISKQVHYFDHPLFGMIVRIHRYRWPEQDTVGEDATE